MSLPRKPPPQITTYRNLAENLRSVGYCGKIMEQDFNEGCLSDMYIDAVIWLCSQLTQFCKLESHVTGFGEDFIAFSVEVSCVLKELGCPYKAITTGKVEERLYGASDKNTALAYLCTELQAAKMLAKRKPKEKKAPMQIELNESKTAKELKSMLICLKFSKPPDNITPKLLFGEVEKKLKHLSNPATPKEVVGELLFQGCLLERQWFHLDYLYKDMYEEYKTRRNLLLTRLDVTVKSFLWSSRVKAKSGEIMDMYKKRTSGISSEPSVKISHVLAAKSDLAIIEKTSSASVRKNTKSSVNSVVIGAVPDRGGRPEEQQPPPPEVPSWQKNDSRGGGFRPSNPPPSASTGYGNRGDHSGLGRRPPNPSPSANTGYSNRGDHAGYGRDNTSYSKSYSYSRDENSNPHASAERNYRGDNTSRGNYNSGGRYDYNTAAPPPMYQPVNYAALGPQVGFGGYKPAGDNFQQYGMGDGYGQVNQYQSREVYRGSGNRGRGGYSDRGSNQSRGGRGYRGGRGRY